MKNNTMLDFTRFLQHMPLLKRIGCHSINGKDLLQYVSDIMNSSVANNYPEEYANIINAEQCVAILNPFLLEMSGMYKVNIQVLRNILCDFYEAFLPELLSESVLQEYVKNHVSGYVLIPLNEFENENHQSYKYLYEMLQKKHEELRENFYGQKYELDNAHKDLAVLALENKRIKENSGNMKNTTKDIVAFIQDFLAKDIVVQEVSTITESDHETKNKPKDKELSLMPGVYEHKRPSWFTPLRSELELNRKNIALKTAKNTQNVFVEKLQFWKKLQSETALKKMPIEKKADYVDEARRKNVQKLICSSISNEEKYIKYMLLTPGMSRDFMKTINGAAQLGLNADVVIELLEQPAEWFNKEMLEAYVSATHKALAYDLKQELAEELIRGEWYITSKINGSSQKYQLVPMQQIIEVQDRLEHICKVFEEYKEITASSDHKDVSFEEMIKQSEMPLSDDSQIFVEPEFPESDYPEFEKYDQAEMDVLFVQQVENEYANQSGGV